MPTASMQASGPRPPVISSQRVLDIDRFVVERLGADRFRLAQPLGEAIDGDHAPRAEQHGARDREQADRPAAPHRDRVARLDVAVLRGHVAGRQNVGEKQHLLVAQRRRHLAAGRRRRTARARTRPGRRRSRRACASSRRCRPASGPTSSRRAARSGWSSRTARTARARRRSSCRRRSGTARPRGRRRASLVDARSDFDDLAHELVAENVAAEHASECSRRTGAGPSRRSRSR